MWRFFSLSSTYFATTAQVTTAITKRHRQARAFLAAAAAERPRTRVDITN